MARMPKPWFDKERRVWKVTIRGRRHNLGRVKKAAMEEFHRLIQQPAKQQWVSSDSLAAVIDAFLEWVHKHRAPDTYAQMIEVASEPIRNLLVVAWETGCRPQESLRVEAMHVDTDNQRWLFKKSESKGRRMPRVVYLTDEALHITRRLMLKHPEGPLFRNSGGRPWTAMATNNACERIQIRLGKAMMKQVGKKISATQINKLIPTMKPQLTVLGQLRNKRPAELRCEAKGKLTYLLAKTLAPRYSLYAFRRSWATHALRRGVDSVTVSVLMGHADPSTLARVYQHLSQNPKYLLDQAKRARG